MKVYRYRQLFLFLLVLVLPTLAIAVTGLRSAAQEEELAKSRLGDERRRTAAEIGQDILARLERIKLQEIANTSATAVPQHGAYSDLSVAVIGWTDRDQVIWPWNVEGSRPPSQDSDFARKMEDAEREEFIEKRDDRAAALYRELIETAHSEDRRALARLRLARTLARTKAQVAVMEIYRGLLALPADVRDEYGLPFASYAAARLIDAGTAGAEVLERINRDLESLGTFTPIQLYRRRSILEALRHYGAAEVRDGVDLALERLSAQVQDLEQAQDLQRDFPKLRATAADWQLYEGTALWLVGKAPAGASSQTLVIAVRAEAIRQSVEADRLARGPGARFQIGPAGDASQPLSARLPDLGITLAPDGALETAATINPQRSLFGLSLFLVVGLTFFGGYLLWRDTRREGHIAELRTQFVSSVSHELKTPLTSIRMFAETLQMQKAIDPELHAECVDTIVNESERLTRLLNNVLDFSRIERGQKTYRLELASLSEVLQAVVRTMRHPLEQQGFMLSLDISDAIPPVAVDRDAIQQAVLNLLTNAMKYSGERRELALRLGREDGHALIQVTDHGIGIPREEQTRIFEKFYRAPVAENRAIAGTGLGLAMVAHVAEAHGGSIRVESAPGAGSTFSLRLPLASVGSAARPEGDSAVQYPSPTPRNAGGAA